MKKVIRNIARSIMLFLKSMVYGFFKITIKPCEKLVFFESFQGKQYACSPKAMYEYMLNSPEYKDYKFVWAFRDKNSKIPLERESNFRLKVVKFESVEYFKYLCRAKYWIFNSNTRYFLKPKKSQVFVQTWHGTPLKKIGLDVVLEGNVLTDRKKQEKIYNGEAEKITVMTAPSEFAAQKFISAFNLKKYNKEKNVLVHGYPRNDRLVNADENEIAGLKERLSIPKDKKVIMYAPTFRDNKYDVKLGFRLDKYFDFEDFEKNFGNEYVLLFRSHYFISEKIDLKKSKDCIKDVSYVEDVNDLLLITDVLITDYSSLFFDYVILKRPVVFYMYDLDEYKNSVRDFYINIDELPGPICKTFEELKDAIKKIDASKDVDENGEFSSKKEFLDEKYQRFYDKFCGMEKGTASRDILKDIIKN